MRYIRFLKTPRIKDEHDPTKGHISCLITITSDLGDSFLPYDLGLSAEICATTGPEKVFIRKDIKWTAGMRALPVALPISRLPKSSWPVTIRIGVKPFAQHDSWDDLFSKESRGVLSAWSAPLDLRQGTKEAPKLVQRRLPFGTIWEETGESIARHIWDAGVMLTMLFDVVVSGRDIDGLQHKVKKVLQLPHDTASTDKGLQVLELGTGCGLVGISLAQLLHTSGICLTDLPEAEDIVRTNLEDAKMRSEEDSVISFKTLDWEEKSLPEPLDRLRLDVIIAADCTYNPDSSPALVNTLSKLVAISPDTIITIAMKVRHEGEKVFFHLMSEAGLHQCYKHALPLPRDDSEEEAEFVDVYYFRGPKGTRTDIFEHDA